MDANTAPINENDERSCFLREKSLMVDGKEVKVSLANFYPGNYTDSIDAIISGGEIMTPYLRRFEA